jgi:hypothetical protein
MHQFLNAVCNYYTCMCDYWNFSPRPMRCVAARECSTLTEINVNLVCVLSEVVLITLTNIVS